MNKTTKAIARKINPLYAARRAAGQCTLIWIHGGFGSGRTTLATELSGGSIRILQRQCTTNALRKLMSSHLSLIVDDFRQGHDAAESAIRGCADGATFCRGIAQHSKTTVQKMITLLLIVISEKPPQDAAIHARCFVVECVSRCKQKRAVFSALLQSVPSR